MGGDGSRRRLRELRFPPADHVLPISEPARGRPDSAAKRLDCAADGVDCAANGQERAEERQECVEAGQEYVENGQKCVADRHESVARAAESDPDASQSHLAPRESNLLVRGPLFTSVGRCERPVSEPTVRDNVLAGRHSPFGATTNAPGSAGRSSVHSR